MEGERGGFEDAACLPLCLSELRVFVRHEEALQEDAEVQLTEELWDDHATGVSRSTLQKEGRDVLTGVQRTDSLLSQLSRKT